MTRIPKHRNTGIVSVPHSGYETLEQEEMK
jgi:hypothetical protein